MTGHPPLRTYLAHMALGASAFMPLAGERSERDSTDAAETSGGGFTRVGREGLAPFIHLLGKRIIAPSARGQLRSLSPVGLCVLNPSSRYLESGANGHRYTDFVPTEPNNWCFDRLDCYWGMAPTGDHDLGRILWGRVRQFEIPIPRTPNGFVAIFPGFTPTAPQWSARWTTDGDTLRKAGKEFSSTKAAIAELVKDLRSLLPDGRAIRRPLPHLSHRSGIFGSVGSGRDHQVAGTWRVVGRGSFERRPTRDRQWGAQAESARRGISTHRYGTLIGTSRRDCEGLPRFQAMTTLPFRLKLMGPLTLVLGFAIAGQAQPTRKPNIIVMLADGRATAMLGRRAARTFPRPTLLLHTTIIPSADTARRRRVQ